MNTVISAMALDYPADQLAVYLSDDGGSYVTLQATREAWKFAQLWVPFCRENNLEIRSPIAYFSNGNDELAGPEMIEIQVDFYQLVLVCVLFHYVDGVIVITCLYLSRIDRR